jgi:hypothetical protein
MELEQEAKVKAALLKSDQKKPSRVSLSPSPLPPLPSTPLLSLSRSPSLFHCLTVVRICKITTTAIFTTPALSLSSAHFFFHLISFFAMLAPQVEDRESLEKASTSAAPGAVPSADEPLKDGE